MTTNDAESRAERDELAKELLPPLPKTSQIRRALDPATAPEGASRPWRGYVPEEWALLERFPLLVGVSVSRIDESGRRGTNKELDAIHDAYANADRRYPNNPLIQGVLGMARQAPPLAERAHQLSEQQSFDALREELIREAPRVLALLKRAPSSQLAEEYKRFVVAVGETVAGAAKEGGFPRFVGVEISEWERQLITWVGEALRLESGPGDWDVSGIDSWRRDL